MIYLKLFLIFLEIGAVSFGGGYGMISIIREKVLTFGWLSEDEFVNFIAVSESTPGPLAVNMATFVGSSQAGFIGGLIATLGVVLPSFVIIFIIASIMKDLLKYSGVKAMLSGIRPCVVAMILATGITMALSSLLNITTINSKPAFDYKALIIIPAHSLGRCASFETEEIQALTDHNYRKLRLSRHNILLKKAVTPQSATAFNICDMKINPEAF